MSIFSVSLLTKRNDTICKGSFSSNERTQNNKKNAYAVVVPRCSLTDPLPSSPGVGVCGRVVRELAVQSLYPCRGPCRGGPRCDKEGGEEAKIEDVIMTFLA